MNMNNQEGKIYKFPGKEGRYDYTQSPLDKEVQRRLMGAIGLDLKESYSTDLDITPEIREQNNEKMMEWIKYGYAQSFREFFTNFCSKKENTDKLEAAKTDPEKREVVIGEIMDGFLPTLYKLTEEERSQKVKDRGPSTKKLEMIADYTSPQNEEEMEEEERRKAANE